jgi:hypothetical protein
VRKRSRAAPVRIVESGAGVGASTSDLLPKPVATGGELCCVFSDVSLVFLRTAPERFADYPFVELELTDLLHNPATWGDAGVAAPDHRRRRDARVRRVGPIPGNDRTVGGRCLSTMT